MHNPRPERFIQAQPPAPPPPRRAQAPAAQETTLRIALARRRRLRRAGLAISTGTVVAAAAALAAQSHTALPALPPAPVLAGCAACVAAAAVLFRAEVGRDGVLYLSRRPPQLLPLAGGAGDVRVRETGDVRGRGAYAAVRIPRWTCLGAYEGERLDNAAYFVRYGEGCGGAYAIGVDAEYVLDGRDAALGDRFTPAHMNHSRRRAEVNVARVTMRRRREVLFYTTRDVEVGEELRFDYGRLYWRGREDLQV
jgi:hypothetical protein